MSRWNQTRERNRATVAQNAERLLADTTYDRLRSARALRALVVMWTLFSLLLGAPSLVLAVRRRSRLID